MAKVLGLDLGTNSIGWAVVDTSANKIMNIGVEIAPEAFIKLNERRRIARQIRRKNYRFATRLWLSLQNKFTELICKPVVMDAVKKLFPAFIHSLLALLFTGSLLMAVTNQKDFQFWFNLAITVLLGWIAIKK